MFAAAVVVTTTTDWAVPVADVLIGLTWGMKCGAGLSIAAPRTQAKAAGAAMFDESHAVRLGRMTEKFASTRRQAAMQADALRQSSKRSSVASSTQPAKHSAPTEQLLPRVVMPRAALTEFHEMGRSLATTKPGCYSRWEAPTPRNC